MVAALVALGLAWAGLVLADAPSPCRGQDGRSVGSDRVPDAGIRTAPAFQATRGTRRALGTSSDQALLSVRIRRALVADRSRLAGASGHRVSIDPQWNP
jgi:hypothetical protein